MLQAGGWPRAKAQQWGTRRYGLTVSKPAPWGGGSAVRVGDQGQPTAGLERQTGLTVMEASPPGPSTPALSQGSMAWPCKVTGEAEGSCPPSMVADLPSKVSEDFLELSLARCLLCHHLH